MMYKNWNTETDIAKLEQIKQELFKQSGQCVGWLYKGILYDEALAVGERIELLKKEKQDVSQSS